MHAKAQAVNFKTDSRIPLANIKLALNAFLPDDIRVKKVKLVPIDFHARFWTVSKKYRYYIRNTKEPSVFCNGLFWHIAEPLDLKAMRQISKKLIGKHDFALFAKDPGKYKSCLRTIRSVAIISRGKLVHIDIEADGFLRSMARNIVSFLVRVGSGKLKIKEAYLMLKGKSVYVNKPAPACGLYLCKVNYKK